MISVDEMSGTYCSVEVVDLLGACHCTVKTMWTFGCSSQVLVAVKASCWAENNPPMVTHSCLSKVCNALVDIHCDDGRVKDGDAEHGSIIKDPTTPKGTLAAILL